MHLARAPLGYSAKHIPLGRGRGGNVSPCLTPEPIVITRWARQRSKALYERIKKHVNFSLKVKVTGQGQVKSQNRCFLIINGDLEQQRHQPQSKHLKLISKSIHDVGKSGFAEFKVIRGHTRSVSQGHKIKHWYECHAAHVLYPELPIESDGGVGFDP